MITRAVITGDIVDSTKYPDSRFQMMEVLRKACDGFPGSISMAIDFFRGDSFQILVDKPKDSARIALLLRSALKKENPSNSRIGWDVRISIGIGNVDYINERVTMSDGEAFRLSGRVLDKMKKERLRVTTPDEFINEELRVSTAFLDAIVTDWNTDQAKIMYADLQNREKLSNLAKQFSTSTQNVSKRLKKAKADLVWMYLERYEMLISKI